ncbi:hypothetical protein AB5I39_09685 [Sphingomonas sp. MMS24-J45]|uniref:hypothetical protein n=1 Tax=Sphingomonas sp. MMS24-J45 TaxID=3238806 RepID=UPI00384C9F3F
MKTVFKFEQATFSQRHIISLAGSLKSNQYDFLDLYGQLGISITKVVDVQAFIAVLLFSESAKAGVSLPAATKLATTVIQEGLIYLACDPHCWHATGTLDEKLRFADWLNGGSYNSRRLVAQDWFNLLGRSLNRFLVKTEDETLSTASDANEIFQNAASGRTVLIDVHALANRLKAFHKGPLFKAIPQSL